MTDSKVIARFQSRITVDGRGCWLIDGHTINSGYARISVEGKRLLAHRFSYEHYKGKIPDGLYVCHTCDVKTCVNPKHLFVGTAQENMQDAKKKGRIDYSSRVTKTHCIRGHEKSGHNKLKRLFGYFACRKCSEIMLAKKLTESQFNFVKENYERIGKYSNSKDLAKKFGVSTEVIAFAARRNKYAA